VLRADGLPATGVQNKHRLAGGLHDGGQGIYRHQHIVTPQGKVPGYDCKDVVQKRARLRADQEYVIQRETPVGIVLQMSDLNHPDQSGYRGRSVDEKLTNCHLSNGQGHELGP